MSHQLKISVVTPCLNQASTLDRTIRSVVNQQDPNLQYIIVDGLSTDSTQTVVDQYKNSISQFLSEKDNGQYDAIAKGFELADGDIFGWINGDDAYLPWTFSVVREIFEKYPDVAWITGVPTTYNEHGQCVKVNRLCGYPQKHIRSGVFDGKYYHFLQQESMFWRRELWEKVDGFNPSLTLAADYELWTRMAEYSDLVVVNIPLSGFTAQQANQRSVLFADTYLSEVETEARNLHTSLSQNLCRTNGLFSELYRQMTPSKCRFIGYDYKSKEWKLCTKPLVTSNISLWNILIEKTALRWF